LSKINDYTEKEPFFKASNPIFWIKIKKNFVLRKNSINISAKLVVQ